MGNMEIAGNQRELSPWNAVIRKRGQCGITNDAATAAAVGGTVPFDAQTRRLTRSLPRMIIVQTFLPANPTNERAVRCPV